MLSIDLQRHANNHFEDDDDIQLANQYQFQDDFTLVGSAPSPEATPYQGGSTSTTTTDENIRCLIASQVRDTNNNNNNNNNDFMTLLSKCLECESGTTSTSILSGYVDHFQTLDLEDAGWGCGWRNIQMLTSHLLVQSQQAKELLFGGVGFVPDIPSLQRWLEIAWDKGFDPPGSNHFAQKIYGKKTWIGTTECAALFRSFGLRARIVDFTSHHNGATSTSTSVGKRKSTQVIGPMDRYLNPGSSKDKQIVKGHQVLVDWVWSYFSDESKSGCNKVKVVVTEKAPLYFQHDGHSRTIVGIQLKSLPNGMQQHNLLILDPGHKTQVVESCLSKKVGWQRFIKRGVHTLKKTEYQLCYVEPGIATGPEMEKLKTLDSTRFEF